MKIKHIIMALFLAAPLFFQAQGKDKLLVIYEDQTNGRPMPFEYNNAKKVVLQAWGLEYRSPSGVDTSDVHVSNDKSIETLNQRHGENWNSKLMGAIKMELSKQGAMRLLIKKHDAYSSIEVAELFIELQPKGKKKYVAKIVGQQVQGDKKPFVIYQVAVIKPNKNKVKFKPSNVRPLDFEYPSNGIVKPVLK
ncbi:MAG: hypothetical protein JKY54_12520 [Flavobacteriales bacterium]|nr:hypothetical protein [Flavobacteriales bacterium]